MTRDRAPRLILAIAVSIAILAMGARLLPPYIQNWKLQSYLNGLSENADSAKMPASALEVKVLNEAAMLGIPLHDGDLKVERENAGIHIRALYVVRVDLPLYTVDLHFRPEAGGA